MATRWKHEGTETLVLMHAHNVWSIWNDCLLTAAADLGLPVAVRHFPNCSNDGSWDTEYYTLAPALDRAGGEDALLDAAHELHNTTMAPAGVLF